MLPLPPGSFNIISFILQAIQPFEIGDEIGHEIFVSQHRGGMVGDDKALLPDAAPQGLDALSAQNRRSGGVSQQADHFGPDDLYLGL